MEEHENDIIYTLKAKEIIEVAISDRIKAEARRTIDGMQKFYDKYSDDIDDAEELEHRIARVEASMEGCNGLTQDEKIQKTAENVFELTCAQERTYDALRREIKLSRDEYKLEFKEIKHDFSDIRKELKEGIASLAKKIEDSGMDSSATPGCKNVHTKALWRIISDHPLLAFNAFMFIILLVFISGHFEMLTKLCGYAGSGAS